jgi:hypothetical protein
MPINPELHHLLVNNGFRYEFVPDSFEDDGDAESGPHLTGGPSYDLYESDHWRYIIDHRGIQVNEERDLKLEAYIESMGIECAG